MTSAYNKCKRWSESPALVRRKGFVKPAPGVKVGTCGGIACAGTCVYTLQAYAYVRAYAYTFVYRLYIIRMFVIIMMLPIGERVYNVIKSNYIIYV